MSNSTHTPRPVRGAREASHSRLSSWVACRMLWFNEYWREHPAEEGARGWSPIVLPGTLTVGAAYHKGLEEYRRSQCRDGEDTGEPDLDRAIAAIEAAFAEYKAAGAFGEEPERLASEQAKTIELLRRFHDHHGPGGIAPLWPRLKILCDESGEPIIERTFETDLGDGWTYVCKPDALATFDGRVVAIEDKTASAHTVRRTIDSARMGAQFMGEAWTIGQSDLLRGDLPAVYLLAHVKNPGRSASSIRFQSDIIDWSEAEIEIWRRNTKKLTQEIDQHLEAYEKLVADGMNPNVAALTVFARTGTISGHCTWSYGRECDYLPLCRMPGREDRFHKAYRPRDVERREDVD